MPFIFLSDVIKPYALYIQVIAKGFIAKVFYCLIKALDFSDVFFTIYIIIPYSSAICLAIDSSRMGKANDSSFVNS